MSAIRKCRSEVPRVHCNILKCLVLSKQTLEKLEPVKFSIVALEKINFVFTLHTKTCMELGQSLLVTVDI